MSSPKMQTGGVVVQLVQACPVCDGPVHGNLERCPACDATRPATGWIPAGADVSPSLSDELEDDPDTATSAPPPVVPVDVPVTSRATPPPASTAPISIVGVYVRFFGLFGLSALVTALLVIGVGWLVLPPPQPVAPVVTVPLVAPSVPVPVPVAAPEPIEEAPELIDLEPADEPVVDVVPAPGPTAPVPVVASPRPPPVQVEPEPVLVPEPVIEPEPVVVPEPTAPSAASALSGAYIGRADGDPISMELTFGAEQRLTAVLRVAGRGGTEVHRVSGTYTMAPDGSADFALTDRTEDGVVGYSGSVSGAEAKGIVTVDGRRRGRFTAGR